MGEQAEVIVLGLGTGGEDLALRLLDAGVKVTGVEAQLLGGECPYWACIPSKMMIRAANLVAAARRVNGVAGHAEVDADWAPVAKRVREEAAGGWDDGTAVARFEGKGGRFVRGWGHLTGRRSVRVGNQDFSASRGIVIATGSRPMVPPIPGLAATDYWSTHDLIQAEMLPRSMIILGGGAVGCELGQVCARFGARVSIVEGQNRLLAGEEPEASAVIAKSLKDDGIDVRTGTLAVRIDADGELATVTLASGGRLSAERILVAAGRSVDLQSLGLAAAGVDTTGPFIEIDDRMRVADGLWAIGDVTGKAMFTHMALHQGRIVAADILGEEPASAEYHAVPRVTFTDPEVGAVGITEAEAAAKSLDVAVDVKRLPSTFRGWIHGVANDGLIKLVVDRRAGVMVGATVVGPEGGEMLGLLNLAVHARLPLSVLRDMIWPYPTFHGGIGEAIGAYGLGIGSVIDPGKPALLKP